MQQVFSIEPDPAAHNSTRRRDEIYYGKAGNGFAATRLAHKRHSFFFLYKKTRIIDGLQDAFIEEKVTGQVFDLQNHS